MALRPKPCYDPRSYREALDFDTTFETTTYYRKRYRMNGWTPAGIRLVREMDILLLEGQDNLLPRELYDLERELRALPWGWPAKPSFLKKFDQWFEWTLYHKDPKMFAQMVHVAC
jgi:hypothetical protein